MHLTLKQAATKPAAGNVLQQQARFDAFLAQYNQDRPHQALGMKVPADVYARSPRVYRGLDDLTYPSIQKWDTTASRTSARRSIFWASRCVRTLRYAACFRYGYPRRVFRRLNYYLQVRFRCFLRNRSQRRSRPFRAGESLYAGLHRYGLRFL
jgi:hypothetical protein